MDESPKQLQSAEHTTETHEKPPLTKQVDPGEFTLSCAIMGTTFSKCVIDTGAETCILPLSIAKLLGMSNFEPCEYSVRLADATKRQPHGILKDVPLMVGGVAMPTDFLVLDTGEDQIHQILLGRPFLASGRALINIDKKYIELTLGEGCKKRFDSTGIELPPEGVPSEKSTTSPTAEAPRRPNIGMETSLSMGTEFLSTKSQRKESINMLSFENHPGPQIVSVFKEKVYSMPRRTVPKFADPGPLYIKCKIREMTLPKCLVDTGASMSVMPLKLAKSLGFQDFKCFNNNEVLLADQSVRKSCGTLMNVLVQVGDVIAPTDFEIFDMVEDPEHNLIIGRPFLLSTGAAIDLVTHTVTLDLGTYRRALFTKNGMEFAESPPEAPPEASVEPMFGVEDYIPLSTSPPH